MAIEGFVKANSADDTGPVAPTPERFKEVLVQHALETLH